jgi:tubulin alpha
MLMLWQPGMITTDMTAGWGGGRNVSDGAKGLIQLIDAMTMENAGEFWHGNYGDGVKPIKW